MNKILITLSMLIISANAFAKDDVIERGFKAFKEGGSALAWPAFAKGGPMEGSKELVAQASQFGQIETYYGKYISHEYIAEKMLSEKNKIVYVILNLEGGPLYARFQLYKNASGSWTAPVFNFHTHVEQVWPANVYSNCSE